MSNTDNAILPCSCKTHKLNLFGDSDEELFLKIITKQIKLN